MEIKAKLIGNPIVYTKVVEAGGVFSSPKFKEEILVEKDSIVTILDISISGLPNSPVAVFADKNGVLRYSDIRNFMIFNDEWKAKKE